jgi:hypothetical protein
MPITNLRRSSTVLLAGVTLATALNLYSQSNPPHSVETLMQKLTHRPVAPKGLSYGIWDARAEYTDLNAYTATAINDWGEVVGYACMPTPQCVTTTNNNGSYLLSQGTYKGLYFPPVVAYGVPSGINLLEQIVGTYFDPNLVLHGFVLDHGKFTSVDAPAAGSGFLIGTMVTGINTEGNLIGQYTDKGDGVHDFVLKHGRYELFVLSISDSISDTPYAINDKGEIVGTYYDGSGIAHGYLLSNGIASTIDFPGALSTEAFGINFEGDVVGFYSVPSTNPYSSTATYGFLLKRGKFITVNPPKGSSASDGPLTQAFGINDLGVIVGTYQLSTGPGSADTLGFLRRP